MEGRLELEKSRIELIRHSDGFTDFAVQDQLLDDLSVLDAGPLLLDFLPCGFRKGLRRRAIPVMDQVRADHLVQKELPFAMFSRRREVLDMAVDPRAQLLHLALDVEHKRLLPKVGIHDLAWGLEANRWV